MKTKKSLVTFFVKNEKLKGFERVKKYAWKKTEKRAIKS